MMPALIDILIIVLLVGTLVYAFILDRRVRALMATLKEMEEDAEFQLTAKRLRELEHHSSRRRGRTAARA